MWEFLVLEQEGILKDKNLNFQLSQKIKRKQYMHFPKN